MNKIIDKLLSILLIFSVVFLVLNEYYIIEFSDTIKNVLLFITLILVLMTATKEVFTSTSKLSKFLNLVILSCTIIGGVITVATNQINMFLIICTLGSVCLGFIELLYKKI